MTPDEGQLSRRTVLGAAAATGVAMAAMSSLDSLNARAQDSTPVPSSGDAGGDVDVTLSQDQVPPTDLGPAIPPEFTDDPTNWPTEHGNLKGTRSAVDSTITSDTVGSLEVAWRVTIDTPGTYGSITATPIVVGDTVYIADMLSNVWALDKASGETKWKTEFNASVIGPNGLAVAYGNVYAGLGDSSEVVSLDAATGEQKWRVKLSNNPSEGIDMAPFVFDNILYISTVPGNSLSFYDGGAKGILYALDVDNGRTLFQWDTTTGNLWGNFRVNSGGGLWHPPVVDDDGQMYVAVANAAPWPGNTRFPNASSRPGDNDYAASLVALDIDNGRVRWHINVKPHDLFDLDLHLSPVLADLAINGADRKVVFASGKLGVIVAADRETGEELWRVPVGTHKNDNLQQLTDEYVEIMPGNLGGVETPMAYSDGILYAAVLEMPSNYNSTSFALPLFDLTTASGLVTALDATTGAIAWQTPVPTGLFAGMAVANDVVFTGGLDGIVRGFRTDNGEQVFTFQASSGLNASPSISGDYLFVPAAGPLVASSDNEGSTPEVAQELIALKIGGGTATPTA